MPEAEVQRVPTIIWLITSGGWIPLTLGIILAAIAIVVAIRPHRTAARSLALLSLLPSIVGIFLVYSAAQDYSDMAVSPNAPRPDDFARVTGHAMSASFCGLLGTMLAVSTSVLAMRRADRIDR